ncbi:NAD-dependent epimerase/dehydratase family protein [Embleya sp. NPDC005575]|uniref:NAD-dependent epimerase/dehydratase family protein n=1 Tax=Embleya sp. NPDC005575 TaxID=3156892 RepID=UPI0033ADC985
MDHVLITGGAGFVGTRLAAALLARGARVTAVDNLSAGRLPALAALSTDERFTLVEHDVTRAFEVAGEDTLTAVVHLASPVGPALVREQPVRTLLTASLGTMHALEIARRRRLRIVLASSAEVYGDTETIPQTEDCRTAVDPNGPLSAYAEGKRFLEALATGYRREHAVDTGIVRPFNIYGPTFEGDSRVVTAFVVAALRGQELRLNGGGHALRSLCFVDDFVAGLLAMLRSSDPGPINLGSADGVRIRDLAELVVHAVGSGTISHVPGVEGETRTSCPDISRAQRVLGWSPTTPLAEGIAATVAGMRALVHTSAGGSR